MKLIDKYILRNFFVPTSYCLLTFCMLAVIFDLFDSLSVFIDARTPLLQIARYYTYILPAMLVFIVPISLLLGLLYSLWQLSKNNELTAMRASGVSLMRLTVPILLAGLFFSILIMGLQETVAPWSSYWADQFIQREKKGNDPSTRYALNLTINNEEQHRIWAISRFDLNTHDMQGIDVVQQRPDGSDLDTIHAEEGKFYDGRWWLFKVTIQKHDFYNNPVGAVITEPQRQMADWTETPEDFLHEVKDPIFLSSRDLWKFMRDHENLSEKTIARITVDMYARLAMPWTCLVVTLFGIPCGVRAARKGALAGVMTALLAIFAFYFLMMFGQWLGKIQVLTPMVSTWLPNLAFAAAGLFMMGRMR
ncbi:MAG: LptF/LptG family permease [Kiritimatiellia bacterium]|jgi:lipopolysaccharide export system permease protein